MTARFEQEPTEIRRSGDDRTYTHPAFGQIAACRTQGGGFYLYDSDFRHDSTVEIRVCRSELNRHLSRDWHHATDEIVSVRLSEAQWATFVSSLNVGTGVPCTIEHVEGQRQPGLVARTEREVVDEEFRARVERVANHLDEAIRGIEQDLAALSKVKREKVLARLKTAQREVADSMPFVAKSFGEHVENTVEKAKVEIEAYVHGRIVQAGLKAIQGRSPFLLDDKGEQ